MRGVVVTGILLASSVAAAQPSLTPAEPPVEPEPPVIKKPGKAFGYAALGVIGGMALSAIGGQLADDEDESLGMGVGMLGVVVSVIGPSAGHAYAGAWGTAATTSLLRLGGGALAVYGIVSALDCLLCSEEEQDDDSAAGALALAGMVMWVGATVYDLVGAPKAARRYNQRAMLAPTAFRSTEGTAGGLALAGRF